MCLNSAWTAFRKLHKDVVDSSKNKLGESDEFKVINLAPLREEIAGDFCRMISRKLLVLYAGHVLDGSSVSPPISLDKFWSKISKEMNEWGNKIGIVDVNWQSYFRNNNLSKVVVCAPLGTTKPCERGDARTSCIQAFGQFRNRRK